MVSVTGSFAAVVSAAVDSVLVVAAAEAAAVVSAVVELHPAARMGSAMAAARIHDNIFLFSFILFLLGFQVLIHFSLNSLPGTCKLEAEMELAYGSFSF